MISIYEHILPKLQLQQIGIDKVRAFITLDDLLHVLSIHNSTSYTYAHIVRVVTVVVDSVVIYRRASVVAYDSLSDVVRKFAEIGGRKRRRGILIVQRVNQVINLGKKVVKIGRASCRERV